MRTEQQMIDLLLRTARQDERIRAVVLNGSRANPSAHRDCFQDFDIVFFVTELQSYLEDPHWIDRFGERIILQTPDDSALFPGDRRENGYAYLMQFADGNRIDLTLSLFSGIPEIFADSQTVVLMDKDGLLPEAPPPSDRSYWIQQPAKAEFDGCCNEFWWVAPYVAKGLWRGEILFAHWHLEHCLHPMLLKMLEWKAGSEHGFTISSGKCGKYLNRLLTREEWERLLRTYPRAEIGEIWEALFHSADLFRDTGRAVASKFGYDYPEEDGQRVCAFLRRVRELPPEAAEITEMKERLNGK